MRFSIVIATYNRARLLTDTLASLSRLRSDAPWELIVVDNNSPDDTAAIVRDAAGAFPVPLRYLFEREPGRSAALNCGFRAAHGEILVTTDDDVQVDADWLDEIGAAFEVHQCDYVGGRVRPVWGGPVPDWLPSSRKALCGVIAIMDFGPEPLRYGTRVPLGVNMAIRRTALQRAGELDGRIGRRAGTLLGQEVREWCVRAHAAGLTGYYVPDIVVRHVIPPERLTKSYFRRWHYWRGVSRAMLYAQSGRDMENPEQPALDPSTVPHIAGVPRYMFRRALGAVKEAIAARLSSDPVRSFDRELWLCFFAGILQQRWRDRHVSLSDIARHATGASPAVKV